MTDFNTITNSSFPKDVKKSGTGRFPLFSGIWNLLVTGKNTISVDTISEKTADNGIAIDGVTLKDGQVKPVSVSKTQSTSITTGVTADAPSGTIETVTATNAAGGATAIFTLTNSFIAATSNVRLTIVKYSGTPATNGLPVVLGTNPQAGSIDVVIGNAHGTNALNGKLTIGFEVIS